MPGVLRHHTGGIAWNRQLDLLQARLDLFRGQFHVQLAFGDVEHHDVPVLDSGDRPPLTASGATWPAMRPCVAPENRPSVKSATESPKPAPTMAAVTPNISRMPGPPDGLHSG